MYATADTSYPIDALEQREVQDKKIHPTFIQIPKVIYSLPYSYIFLIYKKSLVQYMKKNPK